MVAVKWLRVKPKVDPKFKAFKMTSKGVDDLTLVVKKNKSLGKSIKSVFKYTRNAAVLATTSTLVGIGIYEINKYIKTNSGCFLISSKSTCKVKELSCCQPTPVAGLHTCPQKLPDKTCHLFDEGREGSCCRLCDCANYGCAGDQTMECRRPSVGDALSFFASNVSSSMWNAILTAIPGLYWIVICLMAVVGTWLGLTFWSKARR